MELNRLTASEIISRIENDETSSEAVAQACIDRISDRDEVVKAWSFVGIPAVIENARGIDCMTGFPPLRGIPIGIKDVIDTADQPTSYNSSIYAGYQPRTDASCVALLKRAGGLILGKTVTTEFANIHPAETRNPHAVNYSPGGSSSGSAAAVADNMVPVALGTQTAGSTIRPAAYCGVFAIKPSFGSINRAGLKFLAESLDTIGIFSRAPEDLALVLGTLSGRAPIKVSGVTRPRVGICRTGQWEKVEHTTRINFEYAADKLARAGAHIMPFELARGFDELQEQHGLVMGYESARALAWEMQNFPNLISGALKARLDEGWRVSRQAYDAVLENAHEHRRALATNMSEFDFLLTPSAPGEAPLWVNGTGDSVFNRVWTLLGVPCVNVPFGTGPLGLPLGLQLVGQFNGDMTLISWAEWVSDVLHGRKTGNSPALNSNQQ